MSPSTRAKPETSIKVVIAVTDERYEARRRSRRADRAQVDDQPDRRLQTGRFGSVDLLIEWLDDGGQVGVVVLELKNTDWERISGSRVVPNLGRHRRQVWRYLESFIPRLDDGDLVSLQGALVYPRRPTADGLSESIESYLAEYGVEVHYADELLGRS